MGFSYRLSRAYLFNANTNGTAIAQGFSRAVMFFVQVSVAVTQGALVLLLRAVIRAMDW